MEGQTKGQTRQAKPATAPATAALQWFREPEFPFAVSWRPMRIQIGTFGNEVNSWGTNNDAAGQENSPGIEQMPLSSWLSWSSLSSSLSVLVVLVVLVVLSIVACIDRQ